jgi:ATP-dependent Zn protease
MSGRRGTEMPRQRTAYHEAGHAVVAYGLGLEVGRTSVVEDEESMGRAHVPVLDDFAVIWEAGGPEWDSYLKAQLAVFLAGAVAEEIYAGEEVELEGNDLRFAVDLVLHLAGPEETDQIELSERAAETARRILRDNWPVVETLAAELLEHEEAPQRRVLEILDPIPRSEPSWPESLF